MLVASILYPLHSINLNILQVKGRSDLFFYVGLIKKIVGILVFIITIQYDIVTVIVGQIIVSKISYLPNAYYSNQLIGYTLTEQLVDFIPSLLLTSFVAIIAYYIQPYLNLIPILTLLVVGLLAPTLYVLLSYYFKLTAFTDTYDLVLRK